MGCMVSWPQQQIRIRVLIQLELYAAGEEWDQGTELSSEKVVHWCPVAADEFRRRGSEGGRFPRDSELV